MLHLMAFLVLLGLLVLLWEPILFGIGLILKFLFFILFLAAVVAAVVFFMHLLMTAAITPDKGTVGALIAFVGFPLLLYYGYKQRMGG